MPARSPRSAPPTPVTAAPAPFTSCFAAAADGYQIVTPPALKVVGRDACGADAIDKGTTGLVHDGAEDQQPPPVRRGGRGGLRPLPARLHAARHAQPAGRGLPPERLFRGRGRA